MGAQLSTILRGINRDKNRPLQILAINNHEGLQVALAKTGHQFTFINHPQIRPWNQALRNIPPNCCVLQGNDIGQQFKPDMSFDLILCSSRHDQYPVLYQLAMQMSCPIVSMQYELSIPDANVFHVRALADQPYNMTVFDSEFTANSWGFDIDESNIETISRGIDTDFFNEWTGGDNRILTVVNLFPQLVKTTGFELWKEVTNGLSVFPVGLSHGFSQPIPGRDGLLQAYQKAAVFLNTSSWRSCPMSLLEAMSVGCPVVTTATTTIPDFIEDGVNGFITNDPKVMRDRLQQLINEPELGKKIGEAGRQTIIKRFGQKRFLSEWNNVFWKVAQCPPGKF